jgi:hypothetical protein
MEILDDDISFKQRDEQAIRELHISIMDETKAIKQARGALLAMIVLSVLGIIAGLIIMDDAISVMVEGLILLGAFGWAFWQSAKKPLVPFIVALSLYWLHFLLTAFLAPEFGFKGIIVRVILTVYLVKGILACKQFMHGREELRKYGEVVEVPKVMNL